LPTTAQTMIEPLQIRSAVVGCWESGPRGAHIPSVLGAIRARSRREADFWGRSSRMAVRTGFHRVGLVLGAPFVVGAVGWLAVAAVLLFHIPEPGIVVNGPDSREWRFPVNTTDQEIAARLTSEYRRPIEVGYSSRNEHVYTHNPRQEMTELTTAWGAGEWPQRSLLASSTSSAGLSVGLSPGSSLRAD
jgi:hypothetical protein